MAAEPHIDPELTDVFNTMQESEAMVVHSLLTSAGIESLILTIDVPHDLVPGVGRVVVRVNPNQEAEARRVIDEYRNSPAPSEDGVAEDDEEDH